MKKIISQYNNQKIKMSRKIFLNDQGPYKRKHEMLLRDLRECLNPRRKKDLKIWYYKSATVPSINVKIAYKSS